MGGIIEDKIFQVLAEDRITTSELMRRLDRIGEGRKYSTINRHLRKMHHLKQLDRLKTSKGDYIYWNPYASEKPGSNPRLVSIPVLPREKYC